MRNYLSVLLVLCPILIFAQSADEQLDSLISRISDYEDTLRPSMDNAKPDGQFPLLTASDYEASGERYEQFLQELNSISSDDLSKNQAITYRLLQHKLQNEVDQIRYQRYLVPMNAEGGFYNSFPYASRPPQLRTPEDCQNFLTYLGQYSDWLESRITLMQLGIRKGIVAPKPVINNALTLMEGWYPDQPEKSPYYTPLRTANPEVAGIEEIRQDARDLIHERINPFYQELEDFLKNEYLGASPELPGVKFQQGGEEYYKSRITYYTTLPLTADSVHRLGLQEVSRIRSRMDTIIDSLSFEGSFAEFLEFLRTDEQFYPKTSQELLNRAAWLSKRAEAGLPALFNHLYSLPFTVEPVPDEIAPTYTGGRYVPGSWRQKRAGIYWVNTYKLDSRTLYTLPALTLHEAVPGHHLQMMLSAELDVSDFRRRYYISAFGEGWGLYSEFLGEEMGMYETPYDMFGRLTYEMWRACRLVVDTGIHAYGWSREEAVRYMEENTALSLHEVNTEIDRYIGWPGQAVSYKIGEIKIKQLREHAEQALGNEFDVREFHNVILSEGSVTLPILEEQVMEYIQNAE